MQLYSHSISNLLRKLGRWITILISLNLFGIELSGNNEFQSIVVTEQSFIEADDTFLLPALEKFTFEITIDPEKFQSTTSKSITFKPSFSSHDDPSVVYGSRSLFKESVNLDHLDPIRTDEATGFLTYEITVSAEFYGGAPSDKNLNVIFTITDATRLCFD